VTCTEYNIYSAPSYNNSYNHIVVFGKTKLVCE